MKTSSKKKPFFYDVDTADVILKSFIYDWGDIIQIPPFNWIKNVKGKKLLSSNITSHLKQVWIFRKKNNFNVREQKQLSYQAIPIPKKTLTAIEPVTFPIELSAVSSLEKMWNHFKLNFFLNCKLRSKYSYYQIFCFQL